METIYQDFKAGMDNIYNSFFISFLALKPIVERPILNDFIIPIEGFNHRTLDASQLNKLGIDSINEYVNSIRRHMLNDIVICYERYASLMYTSHNNGQQRTDPALVPNTHINAAKFESLIKGLYTEDELIFFRQLRRIRNSIVHYNGVYTKTNLLDYTFGKNKYDSKGHEGENISIELDTLIIIHKEVDKLVDEINKRYFDITLSHNCK